MMILAIDPGPTESAYVLWDGSKLREFGKVTNEGILDIIRRPTAAARCVIEMIGHYGKGMPAGKEVFDTCVWIGRLLQTFGPERVDLMLRPTVKAYICGSAKAKDGNIRQALIDRFGAPGSKAKQGICYGVKADVWQALALAVAWWDKDEYEGNNAKR